MCTLCDASGACPVALRADVTAASTPGSRVKISLHKLAERDGARARKRGIVLIFMLFYVIVIIFFKGRKRRLFTL